jgi:hypothetical protein
MHDAYIYIYMYMYILHKATCICTYYVPVSEIVVHQLQALSCILSKQSTVHDTLC